nr:uncharacterized protein LOC105731716 [Aotus nancymaae]
MRGNLPAQDWQIDFTHMPTHKRLRYLLTFVDTFSGWIEAFPTSRETANMVASILIQEIIPRFGLPATIQSDNSPAFIAQVVQLVIKSLNISWKLHIPYHPHSSASPYYAWQFYLQDSWKQGPTTRTQYSATSSYVRSWMCLTLSRGASRLTCPPYFAPIQQEVVRKSGALYLSSKGRNMLESKEALAPLGSLWCGRPWILPLGKKAERTPCRLPGHPRQQGASPTPAGGTALQLCLSVR